MSLLRETLEVKEYWAKIVSDPSSFDDQWQVEWTEHISADDFVWLEGSLLRSFLQLATLNSPIDKMPLVNYHWLRMKFVNRSYNNLTKFATSRTHDAKEEFFLVQRIAFQISNKKSETPLTSIPHLQSNQTALAQHPLPAGMSSLNVFLPGTLAEPLAATVPRYSPSSE